MQNASTVLMISPTRFGFNEATAKTNSFQNKVDLSHVELQKNAKKEFEDFVEQLRKLDVEVAVHVDDADSKSPDSIFPNNWFSTHLTGEMILFPMAVSNRRAERKKSIIDSLVNSYNFTITDISHFELEESALYLEGTGSLILDHNLKIAYAALSPRTSEEVLNEFCDILGFEPVSFRAYGKESELIYHTNVMMAVGDKYAVIGLNTIDEKDRDRVKKTILESEKEIIELSNDQVYSNFAGNMLQIKNKKNKTILVMSQKAYDSLTDDQLSNLNRLNDYLLPISIPTIEKVGGGSVRCMMAEIFKPTIS